MYLEFPYSPKYLYIHNFMLCLWFLNGTICVFTCEHVTQADMSTLHKKTYVHILW